MTIAEPGSREDGAPVRSTPYNQFARIGHLEQHRIKSIPGADVRIHGGHKIPQPMP